MKTTILNNVGSMYVRYYRSASARINQTVADGLAQGLARDEILKNLTGLSEGLLSAQSQTLAKTSVNSMANNAKVDEYKEQGIEQVEWVVADDHEVEDECDDYDGEIWDIDDAPQPPLHYNCQCTLAPVIK